MSNQDSRIINVGVVGLGFIGQVHFKAYQYAVRDGYPCCITAVCDQSEERRSGRIANVGNLEMGDGEGELLFDPNKLKAYADFAEMIADDEIDLLSVCTHTDTHVEFAIRALEAGKHVLLEKPVAIDAAGVEQVAHAAKAHPEQIIMPAMCMRFWPGWTWLKKHVEEKTYGAVQSAAFYRLGAGPSWASEFYHDLERSGGAAVDLHIHDADFMYHLFGMPDAVSSTGDLIHLTTAYEYGSTAGPSHAIAEGGWHNTPSAPFQMCYTIVFENAVAQFDLGEERPLKLYLGDDTEESIALEDVSGYEGEVRHILDLITGRVTTPIATIDDALNIARIIDAERRSLQTGTRELVAST